MHRLAPAIVIGLVAVTNLVTAGPLHADTVTTTTVDTGTTTTTTTVDTGTTTAATTTTTSVTPPTTTSTSLATTPTTALARRARRAPAAPQPAAEPRAGADLAVTISSDCASSTFCFVPQQLTIVAGDTVTWVNRTGAEHTVVRCTPAACNGASGGTAATNSFGPGTVGAAQGAAFSYTFTAPGTYVYYCTLHGYAVMHGTITVSAAATATTAPPTSAPATTAAPVAPTTPAAPRLAHTGSNTFGAFALALILTAAGLCISGFARRRRPS
jgi:plastocyanin